MPVVQQHMRSSIFCYVTQSRLVLSHRRFGKTYRSNFQGFLDCMILEDWTDRLSRNAGNYVTIHVT